MFMNSLLSKWWRNDMDWDYVPLLWAFLIHFQTTWLLFGLAHISVP